MASSVVTNAVEVGDDVYDLTEDVGVMPLSSNPIFYDTNLNVFSQAQLEVLKGFINKLPVTKHYLMFYTFPFGSAPYQVWYYVFVFDRAEGLYDGLDVVDNCVLYRFVFRDDYDDFVKGVNSEPWSWYQVFSADVVENLQVRNVGVAGYSVTYDLVDFFGSHPQTMSDMSYPFGDLSFNTVDYGFPMPDISNRREVLPQYATVFGLAVLLIFDILRHFSRSIRGRVD